ncbi:MAG: pyridoxamine 5'-phosphate oxidase family protein [Proteobacteria bacterium]|nr:pyridoxamine 5'-phosphate oxidase family protein [Pseudomonadota bacterium]
MAKSKAEIEKEIIAYLDKMSTHKGTPGKGCGLAHGSSLVLATCRNDQPRATTLDFFNEGLTLYILGEPGGKIANVRANPKVSAGIYEQPLDHSKTQKALQIWGKATLINRKNNKELFEEKMQKWGLYDVAKFLVKGNLKKAGVPINQLDAQVEKTLDKVISGMNFIRIEPEKIIMRTFTPDFTGDKLTWTKK